MVVSVIYMTGELVLAKVIQTGNMENDEAGNGMTNTNIVGKRKLC